MPIFELECLDCGKTGEVLVLDGNAPIQCPGCGSTQTRKLMAATSSLTGRSRRTVPGPTDTTCCGNHPGETGCTGPGACCGQR